MPKRPLYLTILCWLMIFAFGINLATMIYTLLHPEIREYVLNLRQANRLPMGLQYVILGIDYGVLLVSAIAILRRHNWGRWLFVLWFGFSSLTSLASELVKQKIVPGIVIYLIVVLLLFLPTANRYFRADSPLAPE